MESRIDKVTVVDYGMGNLSSVAKAFEALNTDVIVSSKAKDIEHADHLVLPGVGAFGEGIKNLRQLGLIPVLEEQVLGKRKPFLGICLGMQLLAREGYEHGHHEGLGWIAAAVKPFDAAEPDLKSIHIGWSEVAPQVRHPLFAGLGKGPNFYFVHRYHMICQDKRAICATTHYGKPFVSAIHKGNILGVQFHPEKSQETGLSLLRNFLRWTPDAQAVFQPQDVEANGSAEQKVRLIPTLLLKNGRLVKTVKFQLVNSGIRRDVGHPIKAPMVYDAQLADELVYLDIHASLEGRGVEQLCLVVGEVAGQIFMPLTVGGGIRTIEDIRKLLKAGADKVAVNSAAVHTPRLIREAANVFGSQCVVVSIDAKLVKTGRYEVFTHSGTRSIGLEATEWARQAAGLGAGEILLTSIDRDGTMEGYELDLIQRVVGAVDIPVIASGGVGKLKDLIDGYTQGHAAALAAASLFHFTDQSPIKAKAFLRRTGVPVR